jgi:hypothetical protein
VTVAAGILVLETMLRVPHRAARLAVRLTLPASGAALRPVLFSHGDGLEPAAYDPLARAWASAGLAVCAPCHAPSESAERWAERARDLLSLAAALPQLARALPGAQARLALPVRTVAGHSFGAHSAALLLGARPVSCAPDADSFALAGLRNAVLLAPPGDGGAADLTPGWAARAPYLRLDWSAVGAPALLLVGTRDDSPLMTPRGWRWHADGFLHATGDAWRLGVAAGAGHYLGGIASGKGEADPPMLQAVAAAASSFILGEDIAAPAGGRLSLYRPGETGWQAARVGIARGVGGAAARKKIDIPTRR